MANLARFLGVAFTLLLLGLIPASLWTLSASAAPVYGKIAFSRQEGGWPSNVWNIWIMNVDGSGETKLTDNTYRNGDPHFRYDGTKIVFGRIVSGTPSHIYVMNPDGTGQTDLTADLSSDAAEPKFSWNGTKIVFAVTVGTENNDIYVMNADGSGKTPLVTGSTNDVWPSFSPDGQYVVFQRYIGPPSNQRSKICRYSISSGIATDLTDGSNLDEMPVYSPDGKYVIFKRGTTNPEIYRLRLDNSALENLTNSPSIDDAPMYSYEGDKIAWFSAVGDPNTAEIWIMNSDGTGKARLTNNNVADFNPTFSPGQQPSFDFSLGNSGGISVSQGSSGSNTITATLVSGSTQTVTLSATGLPSGATASLNPSSGNPTFSSTCTISASSSAPLGSYTVNVTGSGGGKTRYTTFTLTVTAPQFGPTVAGLFGNTSYTLGFMMTGNIYDDSGIGFIYAHRSPPKIIFPKTDTSRVSPTGQPTWSGYTHLVTVGGRNANPTTKYYEDNGMAPLRAVVNANGTISIMRGNAAMLNVALSAVTGSNDYFTMQVFADGTRKVVILWGITQYGTYASGMYFDGIFPTISTLTQGWYVVRWQDLNSNGIPDYPSEFTVVASGT